MIYNPVHLPQVIVKRHIDALNRMVGWCWHRQYDIYLQQHINVVK